MKVHTGDVGGMWGEGSLRILFFPFFLPLFFCGIPTVTHGDGVLTMVLWRGVCVYRYKKKERYLTVGKKEEVRRKTKN